jgi:hypothetical protein
MVNSRIYSVIIESSDSIESEELLKHSIIRELGLALVLLIKKKKYIRFEEIKILKKTKEYQIDVIISIENVLEVKKIKSQDKIILEHVFVSKYKGKELEEYALGLIGQSLVLNFYRCNIDKPKPNIGLVFDARAVYKKLYSSFLGHMNLYLNKQKGFWEYQTNIDTFYIE